MGIKNLNILINNYSSSTKPPKTFHYMVIDGNNLIISYLSSAMSVMSDNIDIAEQTSFILKCCYSMIVEELDKFVKRYKINEIWIVFDPNRKITYNIDPNTFDVIDKDMFNNTEPFVLNAKDDEHIKREKSRNSTVKQFDDDNKRELYGYRNINMLHKLLRTIQKALVGLSRFVLNVNTLDEEKDYLNELYYPKEDYKLYIAKSENNEADFVIKNLCEDFSILHDDYNILVVSKDTDYKVLLCDLRNVWISDLRVYSNQIVNPYNTWRKFFEPLVDISDDEMFDYVIRLAPLFGNDYTSGCGSIISITDKDKNNDKMNLPILLLFDPSIHCKINKRTNLGKFLLSYNYSLTLDENVKNFNKSLYTYYIQSVLLYTNYKFFREFKISTKKFCFQDSLNFIFTNILVKTLHTIPSSPTYELFCNKFYSSKEKTCDDMDLSSEYFL